MSDETRVVEALVRLFNGTDAKDWPAVRSLFAPSVRFDMSSVGGGPAAVKTPEEIVAGWEQGLRPIEAVHHQAGNFLVDVRGAAATASCYGIAYHYRKHPSGRNTRTFVGSYDFELEAREGAWRIASFRFNLKFIDGNLDLEGDKDARPAPAPLPATLEGFLTQRGYQQIPVSMSGVGHLHAAGTINGRAVSILLDTGGASTVVHLGLAKEMGLPLTKLPFQGGGAGAARLDVFEIGGASLKMRDVAPRLRALIAMDLKHINEALAQKGQAAVDVIVGADVFETHGAVIDYGSRSIFLRV